MELQIQPSGPLSGVVELPGDKSISHRAALLAALAQGESRVTNFLVAGVTQVMLDALSRLGVSWQRQGNRLHVSGLGLQTLAASPSPNQTPPTLDCGSSATTLRLLAGALAAAGGAAVLDGSPGLRRRPMRRIVEPLAQMGVPVQSTQGYPPLRLERSAFPLKALNYDLPVSSAQVKTCLLLAGLAAQGKTILREPGPSRDHTERMLRAMGLAITSRVIQGQVPGSGPGSGVLYETAIEPPVDGALRPLDLSIPGDFSSAAFLIVAALIIPGSLIQLNGVGLNPTRTGLLDALNAMGANIQVISKGEVGGEPLGNLIVRHSALYAIEVGGDLVVRMIDEFPVFAVAAAFAEGQTRVFDAQELRYKETDRISLLSTELQNLGVHIIEKPDGFLIHGGRQPLGGIGQAHGDHRLAMSLAILGLASKKPLRVSGAEILSQSFPEFGEKLRSLGAQVKEVS